MSFISHRGSQFLSSRQFCSIGILYFYTVFAMLVKALRLRYMGHKLPVDVLRQAPPMVGELQYHEDQHGRAMTCLLMPLNGSLEPLVQLFKCRMRIEKRGMLIRGVEDIWKRKNRES